MASKRAGIIIAACVAAGIGLAGCSSSSTPSASESASGSAASASSSGSSPAPTFTGANAEFCNSIIGFGEANAALKQAITSGDPEQLKTASAASIAAFTDVQNSLPADAPETIKADFQKYGEAFAKSARAGSPDPESQKAIEQTVQPIQEYTTKICPDS